MAGEEIKAAGAKNNAFDFLRYFSAFCVMLLHFTGAYGNLYPEAERTSAALLPNQLLNTAVTWYTPVVILFTISGFLIPLSLERSENRNAFLKKRFLRIYPSIWLMVFFNALLIIVLKDGIVKEKGFWIWIAVQAAGLAYTPGCLKDFATGSANGAFWSISVLIQFYLAAGLFLPALKKLRAKGWGILLFASALINLVCGMITSRPSGAAMSKILERTLIPYAFYFLCGICICEYRESVLPLLKKGLPLLILVYIPYRLFSPFRAGYYTDLGRAVFTSLTTVSAAFVLPPKRVKTDVTYELYLYHWPVLNLLLATGMLSPGKWGTGVVLFLIITVIISLAANRITARILSRG